MMMIDLLTLPFPAASLKSPSSSRPRVTRRLTQTWSGQAMPEGSWKSERWEERLEPNTG